jgi:hypothetical protein
LGFSSIPASRGVLKLLGDLDDVMSSKVSGLARLPRRSPALLEVSAGTPHAEALAGCDRDAAPPVDLDRLARVFEWCDVSDHHVRGAFDHVA